MTTTEIPEEIKLEARNIMDNACLPEPLYANGVVTALTNDIARALMARDQRAADMLKAEARVMLKRGTIGSKWVAFEFEARADAILTYSAKEPS